MQLYKGKQQKLRLNMVMIITAPFCFEQMILQIHFLTFIVFTPTSMVDSVSDVVPLPTISTIAPVVLDSSGGVLQI